MYIYIYIYIFVYIFIFTYLCTYRYIYEYMFTYMCKNVIMLSLSYVYDVQDRASSVAFNSKAFHIFS